jgi:starch synthase
VIVAGDNKKLEGLFKKIKEKKVETIDQNENYTESYFNLYNELVG